MSLSPAQIEILPKPHTKFTGGWGLAQVLILQFLWPQAAAPAFVVFESWAPRSRLHVHPSREQPIRERLTKAKLGQPPTPQPRDS